MPQNEKAPCTQVVGAQTKKWYNIKERTYRRRTMIFEKQVFVKYSWGI